MNRILALASGRRVDLDARRVEAPDGSTIGLTGTEAALLAWLADHADRSVDRDELLVEVWGWSSGAVTRTIDIAVRRLRVKIEDDPARPRALITSFGEGYRLVLHEPPAPAPRPIALVWRVSGFDALRSRAPDLANEVISALEVTFGETFDPERPVLRFPEPASAFAVAARAIQALYEHPWSATLLADPVCAAPPAAGPWRGPRLALGVAAEHADDGPNAEDRAGALAIAAHGGSALTPADLARSLPAGIDASPVGGHDLGDGVRLPLVRLLPTSLRERTFPPPRTRAALRTNVTGDISSFIGRRRELTALRAALAGAPLVTLHGPAGAGKTRLALRLGQDRAPHYSASGGGAWFVDLATSQDEGDVLAAVGAVLGVPLDPEGDVPSDRRQVGLALNNLGEILIVLDNVEQVEDGARRAVAAWVQAAPRARFVATSRVPLRVEGELVLALPPLEPDEAVALFFERALAARPDALDPVDDHEIVRQIVARLEGNALAIELAAARAGVLSPSDLLSRLDAQLLRWRSLSPAAPARQASLQAAIAWSWDLLDADERSTLAGLALFPAGATAEAIAQVLGDVQPRVARLVDHALVRPDEPAAGEGRVRLPASVLAFALEQPDPRREARAARHASFFVAKARDLAWQAQAGEPGAAARLQRDVENVRSAFRWATYADPTRAAELALALVPALAPRGPHEGLLDILGVALELSEVPPLLRSDLSRARGAQRALRLDLEGADEDLRAASRLADGDPERLASALVIRANLAQRRGQHDLAGLLLGAADRLPLEAGARGLVLAARARQAGSAGQVAAALTVGQGALTFLNDAGRSAEVADLEVDLAAWSAMTGAVGQARGWLAAALAEARRRGDVRLEARALGWLGQVEHEAGRLAEAAATLEEAGRLCTRLGDRRRAAASLAHLGAVWVESGAPRARATLDAALADLGGGVDVKLEGWFFAWRGGLALADGRPAAALEDLRRACSLVEGDRRLEVRVRGRAAWAVWACGRPEEAANAWAQVAQAARIAGDADAARAAEVALGVDVGPSGPDWGVESRFALSLRQRLASTTPGTRRT